MNTPKIFESEYRFCKILWKNEPIKSGQLVQLCAEELGWKPSTTYTVIKRLTERGVVVTEKMIVRALVKEDEAQVSEINDLLENGMVTITQPGIPSERNPGLFMRL
jgi:predicted transcriptional regulator